MANAINQRKLYVISGTFNPLHAGHLGIAEYLEKHELVNSQDILFEISSSHCDKNESDIGVSIEDRKRQFDSINRKCVICPFAKFSAKGNWLHFNLYRLDKINYSKIVFCMGEDTFHRFLDPKNYYDSAYERDRAIERFNYRSEVFLFPRNGTMFVDGDRWNLAYKGLEGSKVFGVNVTFPKIVYNPNLISSTALRVKGLDR